MSALWRAVGVMALSLGPILALQAQTAEEYSIKAAFLYNFSKFVDWPPESFPNATDAFVVCVLGQNPFGTALEEVVRGKTAGDRKIVLKKVADAQQAKQCQILFVSSSEKKRLPMLLGQLQGASVLTVGETEGFIASGGLVNFKLDGERVRLEIDNEAAGRAGLHISAKLLSLAQTARK